MIMNIQDYVDAYHLGYISEIKDNIIDCSYGPDYCCDECPGTSNCRELSNNGHYKEFVENYKRLNIADKLREAINND